MTTVTAKRHRPAHLWHLASLLHCLINRPINLSLSAASSKTAPSPRQSPSHTANLTGVFSDPPAAGHCGQVGWRGGGRSCSIRGAGRSHYGLPLLYARAQSACSICPKPCSDTATERLTAERGGGGRGG